MAKKKSQNHTLSPEQYLKTKARTLPISECRISDGWQDCGIANILVVRQHVTGNVTFGCFLVDTYCLGVKDAFWQFNMPKIEFDNFLEHYDLKDSPSISYNEAHNIIYGALAYAEELGISPSPSFNLAQYILEEDTEEIPLIEFSFGYNGKPLLATKTRQEADKYIPILRKSVGEDFHYSIGEESDFNNEMDEDILSNPIRHYQNDNFISRNYDYRCPDYPSELTNDNQRSLYQLFVDETVVSITESQIKKVLAMPHDTLLDDLHQLLMVDLFKYNNIIETDEDWVDPEPFIHSLLFIGELKDERSLPDVLELLRQDMNFMDSIFGDASTEIFEPTLYSVGRNNLQKLKDYMLEPDLLVISQAIVSSAVSVVARLEPERRDEVALWYKEVLEAYIEAAKPPINTRFFDSELPGLICCDIFDLKLKELLPTIKRLYETGLIDDTICGKYDEIELDMKAQKVYLPEIAIENIYDRYKTLREIWPE